MRRPRKFNPVDDIPSDVKRLIKQLAKRFRMEGLNYHFIKMYINDQIMKEALESVDYDYTKAAKRLGITYHAIYLRMKVRKRKTMEEFNVGQTNAN